MRLQVLGGDEGVAAGFHGDVPAGLHVAALDADVVTGLHGQAPRSLDGSAAADRFARGLRAGGWAEKTCAGNAGNRPPEGEGRTRRFALGERGAGRVVDDVPAGGDGDVPALDEAGGVAQGLGGGQIDRAALQRAEGVEDVPGREGQLAQSLDHAAVGRVARGAKISRFLLRLPWGVERKSALQYFNSWIKDHKHNLSKS